MNPLSESTYNSRGLSTLYNKDDKHLAHDIRVIKPIILYLKQLFLALKGTALRFPVFCIRFQKQNKLYS